MGDECKSNSPQNVFYKERNLKKKIVSDQFIPKVFDRIDREFKERNQCQPINQEKQSNHLYQDGNKQIAQNVYKQVNGMPLMENLKINNTKEPKQQHVIKTNHQRERIEDDDVFLATKPKQGFIFVVKHCDYSKKYGIGYILSNGFTGIYFNDSTKMTLHRDKQSITYLDENEKAQFCSFRNFPSTLAKKVKLLQHFDAYLWKSECDNHEIDKIKEKLRQKERISDLIINENKICVKKWLQEKYAMLFRLTNNTVQVNFTDSSKLVFQDSSLIMYQNKNGQKNIYTLDQVYDSKQKDLKKRFKYTQQLLVKLQAKKRG